MLAYLPLLVAAIPRSKRRCPGAAFLVQRPQGSPTCVRKPSTQARASDRGRVPGSSRHAEPRSLAAGPRQGCGSGPRPSPRLPCSAGAREGRSGCVLLIQAETSLSDRLRDEFSSFSVLRVSPRAIAVERIKHIASESVLQPELTKWSFCKHKRTKLERGGTTLKQVGPSGCWGEESGAELE